MDVSGHWLNVFQVERKRDREGKKERQREGEREGDGRREMDNPLLAQVGEIGSISISQTHTHMLYSMKSYANIRSAHTQMYANMHLSQLSAIKSRF